jgi:hypothetical protein
MRPRTRKRTPGFLRGRTAGETRGAARAVAWMVARGAATGLRSGAWSGTEVVPLQGRARARYRLPGECNAPVRLGWRCSRRP